VKLCDDALKILLKSFRAILVPEFTGKIRLEMNFCAGRLKTSVVAVEEGQRYE